jgi:hypothetical protein
LCPFTSFPFHLFLLFHLLLLFFLFSSPSPLPTSAPL